MTERSDTQVQPPEGTEPASPAEPEAAAPAPALDESAATADRPDPDPGGAESGAEADEHPERLVAGAFVGGLAAALLLKRVARG